MTPEVPAAEQARRQAVIEQCLSEGYAPPNQFGGIGSAIREASRRLGLNSGTLHNALDAGKLRPDWSLFNPQKPILLPAKLVQAIEEEIAKPTAEDHAKVRARTLAEEITGIVTATRYPLINPEAIVVESRMTRRYDRESMGYAWSEGTPRTWVADTLKVAPVADPRGRTFIFTGAQNDAPVHQAFWTNLQAYADHVGAEIVVGPWTYETQWWSENNPASREYAEEIADHMCFGQMAIGPNFVFCGEMNTLPTAARPISDLVTYSRGMWAVFPHAKIQLKSVPSTDPSQQAHQVMTSGAVTVPKVIPRKAGVKSIFHHIIGATIVEFDQDGDLFCRQINASEDGSFYDLDRYVDDGIVTAGHPVKAIVCGDIHVRKLDATNSFATFGFGLGDEVRYVDNLLDVLQPEIVLLHDVYDNESRSHHRAGDSAHSYTMAIRGRDSVWGEIEEAADFVAKVAEKGVGVKVVESNHDIALDRYVREGRYRNDGINVRVGLQLEDAYMAHREAEAVALDAGEEPPKFSLFEYAARLANPDGLVGVEWIYDGGSYVVDGVECGHHGFRGANGSKGTISGFARMGTKMSIGDKHSPEIMDGVYCAGAMNLRHGYNLGPSGWAVSHVIQYANSKRSILTLQSGKFRAARPKVRIKAKKTS